MYTCIVSSDAKNVEFKRVLQKVKFVRYKQVLNNHVIFKTRKLWKLFYLNFHFRKFDRKFVFSKLFSCSRDIVVPAFIRLNFSYEITEVEDYAQKISIDFKDISDIFKIRKELLIKN